MRLGFPPGTRSSPADRNAITRVHAYNAQAIAPHALTVRWSYTVPAGKKYLTANYAMSIKNITAAGTSGNDGAGLRITPSGGAATVAAQLATITGALGNAISMSSLIGATLLTGDFLEGYTVNTGTGGTWDYNVNGSGIEYDA